MTPEVTTANAPFRLGPWLVEPSLHSLSRGGERRRLTHKAMAVLVYLAGRPGRAVSKDELIEALWEGSFTSDEAVTTVVWEVRKALDDSARSPRYIETIRKGGYRLIGPVEAMPEGAPSAAPWWRRAWIAGSAVAAMLAALVLVPSGDNTSVPEPEEDLALGHAALAEAWLMAADHLPAAEQPEVYRQAKASAETALRLDGDLGAAHVALACVYFQHEWDWSAAGRHFELGFEPNACSLEDGRRYAWYLSAMGRHGEAIAVMEQAVALDPAARSGRLALAWTYYLARRWDAALAELELAAELDPQVLEVRHLQGDVFLELGRHQEALRACQQALELLGDGPEETAELAEIFTASGMDGVLRRLVEREIVQPSWAVDPVRLARLEARRDDPEAALDWLERAVAEHHDGVVWMRVDPAFDRLQGQARFRALLERLDLPV